MKFRYLVVDDEPLARKLVISHADKIEGLVFTGEAGDAMNAANLLRQRPVDLIFLDIHMPEVDGLKFIKTLKNPPATIFTTAFRDFAPEAFELEAIDYLLKPIAFERFLKAINRFFDLKANTDGRGTNDLATDAFIHLKADRKVHKLPVTDIVYVESLDEYVKVHLQNKVLVSRETISSLEEKISAYSFVRIHRSFLVNARLFTAISGDGVEVKGKLLPFGRAFKMSALAGLGVSSKKN